MDYWPAVLQVIPTEDYKVYIYFDDGTIRLYDATGLLRQGVFQCLAEENRFMETCTVINNTLAWTPDKSYSEKTCLDLDPLNLYNNCPIVDEPTELFKTV
ncbi:MAG: DUF2442 domain-containing protein [Defluviitaleaceae bacterium]|nr:DUF2442 domain-containing protein [Defluviitaleaceae bacterium]